MDAAVIWIVVFVVLLVVAGVIVSSSPARRLWDDKRPGKPGAVTPTGSQIQEPPEFQKPRDEGNLL
jgi:hypothetical protein